MIYQVNKLYAVSFYVHFIQMNFNKPIHSSSSKKLKKSYLINVNFKLCQRELTPLSTDTLQVEF